MHYQLCLTMFQDSSNNLMVKQGKKRKHNRKACLLTFGFMCRDTEKSGGVMQLDIRSNFFVERNCYALEWTTQEGGGVTIPAGVQERSGHGTQCQGPLDKLVFGQRLDSMISEVFSNLNDSVPFLMLQWQ